jgi:hypothetical protein
LTTLLATPTAKPTIIAPAAGGNVSAWASHAWVCRIAPMVSTASTSTKRLATRANVLQLISPASFNGLLRAATEATVVTTTAVKNVGSPKSRFSADVVSSTTAVAAKPPTTNFPCRVKA